MKEKNVDAPVFIAIATKCGFGQWAPDNPTANGQRLLVQDENVFLGADTDALLFDSDRGKGICHFAKAGQIKTAESYALAIRNYLSENKSKHAP